MKELTDNLVEQTQIMAPEIKRVSTLVVLWGTSYTLQDIASIVSIAAGSVGFLYSIHLLVKFWWDNLIKPSGIFADTKTDNE